MGSFLGIKQDVIVEADYESSKGHTSSEDEEGECEQEELPVGDTNLDASRGEAPSRSSGHEERKSSAPMSW